MLSLIVASLFQPTAGSVLYRQESPTTPVSTNATSTLNNHRKHEDYVAAWAAIERRIRAGFYARKGRKDEMEKLLAKTKNLAEASTSDAEFKQRVEAMIAEFGDSHFDLLTQMDQGYYLFDSLSRGKSAEKMPFIGAWFKEVNGGYRVQMVLEGTEAAKVGLAQGDTVLTADGKPFEPVGSFLTKVDHVVTLQVSHNGVTKTCLVTPRLQNALDAFLEASRNSVHVITQGKKKIGYMHLWTQANADFKNALSAAVYGTLQNTDAMILDLRDGFGGRPEDYADPFFRPDTTIVWDTGYGKQTQHFGYGRPLIVLINGGSRSAKEMLSFILKKSHRAKLIGTQTAGNVLGTSPSRLNSWAYLELPLVDVSIDGIRLEKNGVKPDIEIKPEHSPEGVDLVLQKALAELGK